MTNRRVAPLFVCVAPVALLALVACGGDKPVGGSAGAAGAATTAAAAKSATPVPTGSTGASGAGGSGASAGAGGATAAGGKARPATVTGIHLDPALVTQCKVDEASTYFEYDPPTLKGPDLTPLNILATCVTKGPLKGKTLEVVGYAEGDAKGSRAQGVADYLEAKDVKKDKLKVVTKGDEKTLAKVGKAATEPALTADKRVTVRLGKLSRGLSGGRRVLGRAAPRRPVRTSRSTRRPSRRRRPCAPRPPRNAAGTTSRGTS